MRAEIVTVAGVIAGTTALIWFSSSLSFPWLAALWAALLLVGAALLRRRWHQFFGPVLLYDLVRTARRGQIIAHRSLYAFVLLGMLLILYWTWFPHASFESLLQPVALRPAEVSSFAHAFFNSFMIVQFIMVLIITPAYTAGAVAEERERRTLGFLLATDLTNREIIMGLLAARIGNLALVLLSGLPVLGFLQLLGGVDPNLLLAGFLATMMTVGSVGSLSILVSVYSRTTLQALVSAYLWMFMLLLGSLCGLLVLFLVGQVVREMASAPAFSEQAVIIFALLGFALLQAAITLLHCRQAIVRLRAVAREMGEKSSKRDELVATERPVLAPVKENKEPEKSGWGPYPEERSLPRRRTTSADSFKQSPPIGDSDALFWKELHVEQRFVPSDWGVFFTAMGGLIVFLFLLALLVKANHSETGGDAGRTINGWVKGLQLAISAPMYLLVGLSAAGRISREREQQTLEGLLMLPVERDSILFLKWLGSILSVRWFWWALAGIWILGVVMGGLHPLAVPLLAAATAVYTCFVGMLGLWFSSMNRTTLRATLFTVLVLLVLVLGPGFLLMRLSGDGTEGFRPERGMPWQTLLANYGMTPTETLSTFTFIRTDVSKAKGQVMQPVPWLEIAAGVAGLHLYMGATMVMWLSARHRLRAEKGPAPRRSTFSVNANIHAMSAVPPTVRA
jgi:ABC-type transport system involved in multi-copper enzyme maturation permease subunit